MYFHLSKCNRTHCFKTWWLVWYLQFAYDSFLNYEHFQHLSTHTTSVICCSIVILRYLFHTQNYRCQETAFHTQARWIVLDLKISLIAK